MFGNLLKAAVGIVTLPVDAVGDVIGEINAAADGRERRSLVAKKCRDIAENLERAVDPDA